MYKRPLPLLERFPQNPILEPDTGLKWESKAVFNPAAIYEGGKSISCTALSEILTNRL